MKRFFYLISFILIYVSANSQNSNDHCINSKAVCFGYDYFHPLIIQSGVIAELGPDYGCLGSKKNPNWYHFQIEYSGDLIVNIEGDNDDVFRPNVNFICWGPFEDPFDPCLDDLNSDKIVDCSKSISYIEEMTISNAVAGDYYILLIVVPTYPATGDNSVHMIQTGGAGSTNCILADAEIFGEKVYCTEENIQLYAADLDGASYLWTGPNGFSSTSQEIFISDAEVEDSGTYNLELTVNGESEETNCEVLVNIRPDFTPGPDFTIPFGESAIMNPTVYNDNPDDYAYRWASLGDFYNPYVLNAASRDVHGNHTFYLAMSPLAGGCEISKSIDVEVTDFEAWPHFLCEDADYVCSGVVQSYEVLSLGQHAVPGPDYGVIGLPVFVHSPHWLIIDIEQAGDVELAITAFGPWEDLDYVCWGPFTDDIIEVCESQLTEDKVYQDSPSQDYIEYVNIDNAQAGEYYVLVVSPFQSSATNFTIEQTGGDAILGCTDVPVALICNSPICVGEDLEFSTNEIENASYYWEGPNGFVSTEPSFSIGNATLGDAGEYTLYLTVNGFTYPSETKTVVIDVFPEVYAGDDLYIENGESVQLEGDINNGSLQYNLVGWLPEEFLINPSTINPTTLPLSENRSFTFTAKSQYASCMTSDEMTVFVTDDELTVSINVTDPIICEDESTTLTANVSGGTGTYTYSWSSVPVGVSSSSSSITVYPEEPTIYFCEVNDGNETVIVNAEVMVYLTPEISAGTDQNINYGESTILDGNLVATSNDYTISWEPAELLINPNILNPATVALTVTTDFTLSVTNNVTGCTSTDVVRVNVADDPLSIDLIASETTICSDETTVLTATATGGSGSYSYSWTSSPLGYTASTSSVTVSPDVTTTYYVTVDDGVNPVLIESVDIVVVQSPIVVVQSNQNWCSSDPYQITGSSATNHDGISWSSSGTGTFNNPNLLNPIYSPSSADFNNGSVVLSLTASAQAPCSSEAVDSFSLFLSQPPTVNAGADVILCNQSLVILNNAVAENYESLLWSSSGTGTFNDASILNANYTFSEEDKTNGTVILSLNVVNSICGNLTDTKEVNYTPTATINAGNDLLICEDETILINNSSASDYASLSWSTSGDGNFDNNTLLHPTYTPGANDINSGTVSLTLQGQALNGCTDITTDMTILSISSYPTILAAADTNICDEGVYYFSVSATDYTSTSFVSNGSGTLQQIDDIHYSYEPSMADFVSGTVQITMFAQNTPCSNVSATQTISLFQTPEISAGASDSICRTDSYVLNGASASHTSALQWTSSGSGTFDDASLLHPEYTPSLADILAGSVELTLEGFTATPCPGTFTSTMELTIIPEIIMDAGADTSLCGPVPHHIIHNFVQHHDSIVWTTTGSGVFVDNKVDHPIFIPTEEDVSTGYITLSCTAYNSHCPPVTDEFTTAIYIISLVNMAEDTVVCKSENVDLWETEVLHYLTIDWSTSGSGTFSNEHIEDPIYFPSDDDLNNGSVMLTCFADTLTPCEGPFPDSIHVTFRDLPLIDAGTEQSFCGNESFEISGCTASYWDQINWTSTGSGTFLIPVGLVPEYLPSDDDLNAGGLWFYAEASNDACEAAIDSVFVNLFRTPEVFAGNDVIQCSAEEFVIIGASAHYYNNIQWTTTGSGYFVDPNILQATYVPGPNDIALGTITHTLEVFSDESCNDIYSDSFDMQIIPAPVIDAGYDTTVCDFGAHIIYGASVFNYEEKLWSCSGSGELISTNAIVPTYYPTAEDFENGSVTLRLTASNGPCDSYYDERILHLRLPPEVYAGNDETMCSAEPFEINSATAIHYDNLIWTTSGTGSIVNPNSINPTYIASEGDRNLGSVVLTLEAISDASCPGEYIDEMTLFIVPLPQIDAGENLSVCELDTAFVTTATAVDYDGFFWTASGNGSIMDEMTLTPSYIPSSDDVNNGFVTLTLHAVNPPCTEITDQLTVSVTALPDAWAGPDTAILAGETYHVTPAFVENYSYYLWTSSGSGSFDNPTYTNPVYTPSPMDTLARVVYLTLSATSMGDCGTTTDYMKLIINDNPYVDFIVQHPCAETPVQFAADTIIIDTAKVIEYHWDFGDGTFSDEMNPVHTYAVADTYEVTLTITDTLFAQYSETKYVDVNPLPYAFFSYDQPTCSSSAVNFHDESNVPSGYITTWHFDFGDGSDTLIFFPDIPEDVAHVYPMDMTYDVTLTVETSQGCIDNFTQQVTVEPAPIAMFEYADTCQNMAATFTSNTVVNGGGNIVEYFWNFGDPESGVNNYAEGESAYHIYSAPGDYTVQHVAVNAQGCSDTVTQTITILEQPAVDFTFESNCQDQNVTFAIDPDVTNIADLALWHWDFGDGSESWEQNPVHIYAAAGVYTVTLYIENTAGCSNSVSQVITISDAPSALFDYSAPTCFGDPVDFVYISNPGAEYIVTWNWDWGNGETSTVNFPDDPNMSITYAEAGTYQVTLEVINASGCTATYSTDVVVNPTPVANLSFEQACQGNEVAFTSLSQGNGAGTITHYEWNFGDPTSGIDNTSDLVNPTHIYDNPGTYDVSLTVTAINGCSDTRDTTITVNPAPEVDFAFEAACLGDATVFNSSDYVDVASIGEWHWDFGDGTTSNNPDPEHVYVIAGSYEVVLTVTDINGCDASAVKTVDIMNAPVAAFIFSGDACEGGVISFDDQSTADEVISQWVWDFGDGTTETVDYPNNPDIEHTFVQDGTFNVTLSIITETACESTYTQEVIISTAPEALIEYTPACLNAPFEFEGDALLNGGTEIWQWAWDFGDPLSGVANTSELQNANHTYTTAGTYTVSLVVTNMDGCTDTAFVDVSVGVLPEIAMIISSPACLGDTVSVDPDPDVVDMGAVDFIHWDMGDGNEYTADSVDHIYEFTGIYEITMTLTDTSGCVVSTISEVEVTEKPIVQFDASAACEGNDTQFTDYSYVPNGEPIIQWAWDFDIDGAPGTATSELQNPTYNYPEAGDYTVRLVVTSASGCMDSLDMMISVLEGPNAGFTFEEFNCEAGKVIFTDTSEMTNNIPIVAWEWTFQDGYYSDEQHPYHIFDNTDETYDVILKVTDINGCEDSDTVAVYVPKALEVDFEYTPTCVGDVTYFNDTLIAPVGDTLIQWQWEFGDAASGANNFSTNQSPSHTYPEPGNYVVTLTATDKYYCTYTISKSIEIFPLPTAQFSYDQPQCSEELYFTDLSVGVVSQIQQWEWNWGDGTANDIVTSAQTEPLAHTYLVDGDYDVSLTVTDENNCVHSFMMTVTKNPCVQALFAMSQDTICARNEVTIFDQSIPVGEVDNWAYDMGDGTTYTFDQTNYTGTFDHTYTVEGRYTITLNVDGVVNGTLYMDSEMHEIEVLSTPVPAFVAENVCFGLETQFIDQSTDAAVELVSWNWDLGDEVHTSTQQDTSIIYAEYNTYDVKLIVENEAGCKDSITQQTRIYANPEADFSWDISCVTKPTFFYDETTLPEEDIDQEIVDWNWDFGVADIDWDTSESQDPYYVYDTVMVHPVTLSVTDNNDCISTLTQEVETYVVPEANFTYAESEKTQGHLHLTDLSTGGNDLVWEYQNELSIEQNLVIEFEDDGIFPIHQIVKNEYQCADTMTVLYEMLFRTLFIPNAFSPNNPNSDVHEFKPVGRNLAEYRLQIFDLRGNLLFESSALNDKGAPEEGWDGKAMGIEMPAGIYMYRVTGIFEDGSVYNGTVIGDYKDSQESNVGQLLLIR